MHVNRVVVEIRIEDYRLIGHSNLKSPENHISLMQQALYRQLAKYYDGLYSWKDYEKEVDFLLKAFSRYGVSGKNILEIACGTGNHTKILTSKGYHVTGIDLNKEMLRIAKQKVGHSAILLRIDMRNLDSVIDGRYDATTCLFSSICYNQTKGDLRKSLSGMYNHTKDGGIVVFDSHFMKRDFVDGFIDITKLKQGTTTGVRFGYSRRKGNLGEISFAYWIRDGSKEVELKDDVHRLGLFDVSDFTSIARRIGFGRLDVFDGWTFRKVRERNKTRNYVFVGVK